MRGGLASIERQKANNPESPFVAKIVDHPRYSEDLAEFVGILLGDGCINKNQISISLNSTDDVDYANYVIKLIEQLFNYLPSKIVKRDANVTVILLSRINIVRFLLSIGMKAGNKVAHQVEVPQWILDNIEYSRKCLRGLIDTDGCIYVDRHLIKAKLYMNLGLNFTNHSLPLIDFVKSTWRRLDYHSTQSSSFSIFMRREKEIISYMKKVGSSNPKIERKFQEFIDKKGRVAELA